MKNPYEKHNYKKNRLKRSFQALVGTKNSNKTFQEQPDRYYAHVYVEKRLWEAISFLAKVNGLTKMETVNQLLELGISRMLGTAIAENNQAMIEMDKDERRKTRTRLIQYLIRWAKSKGYEVGDIF